MAIRVLVADDNTLIRKQIRSIVESEVELEVCAEAANGQEALEKAQKSCPDVAGIDFQMPVMDGLKATRRAMWFSIFLEKPFVRRVKRPIPIRMVKLCRSTKLLLTCFGSGFPLTAFISQRTGGLKCQLHLTIPGRIISSSFTTSFRRQC